jgi:hypothetical protein
MVAIKAKSEKIKTVVSKRQTRKAGPNPSNTWQQQPKIKSMEARAQASLRVAGFAPASTTTTASTNTSTNPPSKLKKPIDPEADFINSAEYKFGRLLASPNARTRHSTILKLKEYLQARTDPSNSNGGLSVLDLMKLWKGMWHTLYLCDGVAVQEEVSKVLAELMWAVGGNQEEDEYAGRFYLEMEEGDGDGNDDASGNGSEDDEDEDGEEGDDDEMQIIEMEDSSDEEMDDEEGESNSNKNPAEEEDVKHCRGAHLSALYVRTFFRTLTREWSNMDKYRIDKFYTLSRLILREIYRYMASRHWNLGIIRLFNDAIFEEVLKASKYGNGVRFHLLDICLEELARVNKEEATGLPLTEATFLDALEPYFALAQRVEDKIVQKKVMDKVILRFLEEFSVASDYFALPEDGEDLDQEAQKRRDLVLDQVHVGTVGQFIFELASDTETSDRYRTGLYDMHKTFMKRLKAVGRDVAMSEEEEDDVVEEEDEDVPVEEEEEAVVEDEPEPEQKKSKKKRKKAKTIVEAIKDVEVEEAEQEASAPLKKDKASKKKKKKAKEAVTLAEPVLEATEEEDLVTPTKKKRKSKKGQQEAEIELTKEEEEIITISMQDQKAAAKAVTKAVKAAKEKSVKKAESASSSKRVKFGKMNQSKSYNASMKDLKKVDPKAILVKTPEKSILMTKKKISEEKKRRKKSR